MIKLRLFLALFVFPTIAFAQKLPTVIDQGDFSIGKTITISSNVLEEERVINIYLPLGYAEDSTKKYPVIYLLDGSRDEDFIHIAGIVQFANFSWINILPQTIVVGIGNVDRRKDFTSPSDNKQDLIDFPSSGYSRNFIRFIEEELQPFIDASFKTSVERTLIGQSLGGLLATEILFRQPDLFDNYIIVSPSLWWNDEKLLKSTPRIPQSEKSIYIAVVKEGEVMERTARQLHEKLKNSQMHNAKLYFDFLADKTHGDALHIAVYHAFEKMKR